MHFSFVQWKPDPEAHADTDSYARTLHGDDADTFLSHWQRWVAEFPEAFKVVTLAIDEDRGYPIIQFRLWFGEPSIRHGYADSNGHNLIVHVEEIVKGNKLLFHLLALHLIGERPYTKEVVNGVDVWRLKDEVITEST